MSKLIGYARVSTRGQDTDRQEQDLHAAGVRRDDTYVDRGVSGGRASRPELDRALDALLPGDTFVVATLDRLGRNTAAMLALAERLRAQGVALRVLNLGGDHVDTSTPVGSMLFTVMAALAEMELKIKQERVADSTAKRRAAGKSVGGRKQTHGDAHLRAAWALVDGGEPAAKVARDLGIARSTLYRRQAAR